MLFLIYINDLSEGLTSNVRLFADNDQMFNNSVHRKLESVQYNAALAITGAMRGSSREKNYQELGFESLQ